MWIWCNYYNEHNAGQYSRPSINLNIRFAMFWLGSN
jgi:hypothetical protein